MMPGRVAKVFVMATRMEVYFGERSTWLPWKPAAVNPMSEIAAN